MESHRFDAFDPSPSSILNNKKKTMLIMRYHFYSLDRHAFVHAGEALFVTRLFRQLNNMPPLHRKSRPRGLDLSLRHSTPRYTLPQSLERLTQYQSCFVQQPPTHSLSHSSITTSRRQSIPMMHDKTLSARAASAADLRDRPPGWLPS